MIFNLLIALVIFAALCVLVALIMALGAITPMTQEEKKAMQGRRVKDVGNDWLYRDVAGNTYNSLTD